MTWGRSIWAERIDNEDEEEEVWPKKGPLTCLSMGRGHMIRQRGREVEDVEAPRVANGSHPSH